MGRVYGAWAGRPQGVPEDVTRCVESVFADRDWIPHQCTRKRGHGPEGLYCKQHARKRADLALQDAIVERL